MFYSLLSWLIHGVVNVLEVKPVEMCESAVPAPDGKIPAADRYIMVSSYLALPA